MLKIPELLVVGRADDGRVDGVFPGSVRIEVDADVPWSGYDVSRHRLEDVVQADLSGVKKDPQTLAWSASSSLAGDQGVGVQSGSWGGCGDRQTCAVVCRVGTARAR